VIKDVECRLALHSFYAITVFYLLLSWDHKSVTVIMEFIVDFIRVKTDIYVFMKLIIKIE